MSLSGHDEATEADGESQCGLPGFSEKDETKSKKTWDWSSPQSKILIGSLVSVTTAVAWGAFSELVQDVVQSKTLSAPFSLAYFFMMFPTLIFPVFLCAARLTKLRPIGDIIRECIHLYQVSEEVSKIQFIWKTCLFCFVSTLTMYTYIRALHKLGAADCTALMAANHSFVYLLSWIVLFEKFIALRIFAMIFSITGIVLFAYVDGFGSPAMFGVVLGVASSAGTAAYRVLYKKFVGEVSGTQALFFISVVGLFSALLLWPVSLLLYLMLSETIAWTEAPWVKIVSSAALMSVYWTVKECTEHLTYAVFAGLGLVLAVPICAVADTIWKNRDFSGMKIAALVLISTGVLLILLPEDWHDLICKRVQVRSKRRDRGDRMQTTSRLSEADLPVYRNFQGFVKSSRVNLSDQARS